DGKVPGHQLLNLAYQWETPMRMNPISALVFALCAAALTVSCAAQTDTGTPHLRKQGTATQLMVDGKPYLALAGELMNNSATALEPLEPTWPKLVAANLNTVLVGISWAQMEPEEGKFNFA